MLLGNPSQHILDCLQTFDRTSECVSKVLSQLLLLERHRHKEKQTRPSKELLGTWQLQFIAQKKVPHKSGVSNQDGKVIPSWLSIQLSYEQPNSASEDLNQGLIRNRVKLGAIALELTGPWLYDPRRRIMAFDFLTLKVGSFGKIWLDIPVRGGKDREAEFLTKSLKDQAFFSYFWITPEAIAARGKGGGIALWTRVKDS